MVFSRVVISGQTWIGEVVVEVVEGVKPVLSFSGSKTPSWPHSRPTTLRGVNGFFLFLSSSLIRVYGSSQMDEDYSTLCVHRKLTGNKGPGIPWRMIGVLRGIVSMGVVPRLETTSPPLDRQRVWPSSRPRRHDGHPISHFFSGWVTGRTVFRWVFRRRLTLLFVTMTIRPVRKWESLVV